MTMRKNQESEKKKHKNISKKVDKGESSSSTKDLPFLSIQEDEEKVIQNVIFCFLMICSFDGRNNIYFFTKGGFDEV